VRERAGRSQAGGAGRYRCRYRQHPGHPPTFNASFRRALRAEDKNQRTVKSYTEVMGLLTDFLAVREHPLPVTAITRADVRASSPTSSRWKARHRTEPLPKPPDVPQGDGASRGRRPALQGHAVLPAQPNQSGRRTPLVADPPDR
jgi:hypothetical protein